MVRPWTINISLLTELEHWNSLPHEWIYPARPERTPSHRTTSDARARVATGLFSRGHRGAQPAHKRRLRDGSSYPRSSRVALGLERKGFPSIRRVLRSPERWGRIVEFAAHLGERLPPEASARALEEFLAKRRQADPARFPDVSLAVVKLLGRGEYAVELPGQRTDGHFAMSLKPTRDYGKWWLRSRRKSESGERTGSAVRSNSWRTPFQ